MIAKFEEWDACGEVIGCDAGCKRSAGVAPEVDLRECTLYSPPQKQANKAKSTLVLKRHQKSKPGVPVAPEKDMWMCPPKL